VEIITLIGTYSFKKHVPGNFCSGVLYKVYFLRLHRGFISGEIGNICQ